jgi:hypothetical protein
MYALLGTVQLTPWALAVLASASAIPAALVYLPLVLNRSSIEGRVAPLRLRTSVPVAVFLLALGCGISHSAFPLQGRYDARILSSSLTLAIDGRVELWQQGREPVMRADFGDPVGAVRTYSGALHGDRLSFLARMGDGTGAWISGFVPQSRSDWNLRYVAMPPGGEGASGSARVGVIRLERTSLHPVLHSIVWLLALSVAGAAVWGAMWLATGRRRRSIGMLAGTSLLSLATASAWFLELEVNHEDARYSDHPVANLPALDGDWHLATRSNGEDADERGTASITQNGNRVKLSGRMEDPASYPWSAPLAALTPEGDLLFEYWADQRQGDRGFAYGRPEPGTPHEFRMLYVDVEGPGKDVGVLAFVSRNRL